MQALSSRAPAPAAPGAARRAGFGAAAAPRRAAAAAPRPRALPAQLLADLAEAVAKPGSVDAPIGAVVVGAVAVTAASFGASFALKPGADAAIAMAERDARSGRFAGAAKKGAPPAKKGEK